MEEAYLKKALELAEIRRGFCAPNPCVGAVVVKDNRILSMGYHHEPGHPHAEVEALAVLSDTQAKDSVVFSTLEPCCFQGRTPACTDLLIQKKVSKVVYAYEDPNPRVKNQGATALAQAGIEVRHCPMAPIDRFYQSYAHWVNAQRPWVTTKLAMSLDGKIAGPGGKRIKLTGETIDRYTHQRRKKSDALLTTARTIQKDDPRLNVRLDEGEWGKPLYLIDRKLELSLQARVFQTAEKVTVFFDPKTDVTRRPAFEQRGIELVPIPAEAMGLDLHPILDKIGKDGVHDLWVEAGGTFIEALISKGLVGESLFYIAPKWLGTDAQAAFPRQSDFLNQAKRSEPRSFGEDVLFSVYWE